MKKNVLNFRTLAALLVVGAAFTACSNDQDFKIEKKNAPTDQAYTLTVQATKESDAITRGLNLDGKKAAGGSREKSPSLLFRLRWAFWRLREFVRNTVRRRG